MDTGYGHQCKQHGGNSSQVDTRQQGQGNIKIHCYCTFLNINIEFYDKECFNKHI